VLRALQERVARIVAGLGDAEGFDLAGGAALIVRGDVNRRPRDLDYFGASAAAVDRLMPAAEVPTSGSVGSSAVAVRGGRSRFDSRRHWPGRIGPHRRRR